MSSASAAQFVIPAAVQVISTPLHLLGLDLYNRPGVSMLGGRDAGMGEEGRLRKVFGNWGVSAVARMGRIVPAFGVGGVVNGKVRGWGMGKLEA